MRVGILAGSALLWFSNMVMHPRYLACYGLLFAGLWLAAVWRLKKIYPRIIADLVEEELPDFHRMGRNFKTLFQGATFRDTLLERLQQAEGDEARWCADLLAEAGYRKELDQAILEKLPSCNDTTRLVLLPLLSEGAGRSILDVFLALRDPAKPRLMLALAQTARRILADIPAEEERRTFELATLPEVKACFLRWLADSDAEGFDSLLDRWLAGDTAERRAACLALANHGAPRHRDRLCTLLAGETDASVKALAIRALPGICPEETLRQALAGLDHPEPQVRRAATAVLDPADPQQIKALTGALTDPDPVVRETAVNVLRRTPRRHYPLLLEALADPHPWKRDGLLQVAPDLDLHPVDYDRAARAHLRLALQARLRRKVAADLPDNAATRLLLEHLDETARRQTEKAVRILAARQPGGELEAVWHGLNSGDPRRRQDSLEALESLLDRRMARPLLTLLENREDRVLRRLAERDFHLVAGSERVEFLRMLDENNWITRVLVLEALASAYRVAPYRPVIETMTHHPHPAVAHTARHAILSNEGAHEENLSCLIDRITHIRKVDLFSELDTVQLATAAWQSTVQGIEDGGQIAGPERALDSLMLIVSGKVVFRRLDAEGHPVEDLHQIEAGDWFGAAALFGMAPKSSLGAYAEGQTILLRIDRETFISMVREQPDLGLNVARGLAKVVADVLRQLQNRHRIVQTEEDTPLQGAFCRNEDECSLFERVRLLRRIALFTGLDSRTLTALAMIGRERRLAAGERLDIFSPDHRGLWLIASGELEIVRQNAPLLRRGAGEYFGLGALFDLPIDKLEARAQSDSRLLRIPPEEFQACVREHPDIILRCCEALTRVQSGLLDQVLYEREQKDGP
ncbi:MAG: hypothetical protein D6740_02465 [Alphaproteobacteria bacterium]|nr:MAG: hypothetical protein D6740_02465 [Alphaproteobacteria bacterium]